jgi:hypothetical protein
MKTIITLLTTTMLVAGASSAMAFDRQATDDALSYAISQQAAHGFGGAASSVRVPTNAFASAQPGRVHMNRIQAIAPTGGRDFQLQGRGLGE